MPLPPDFRMIKRPLKNRDITPKQYFVAKATNGELVSGGLNVGYTGSSASQGSYIVVRSTAGLVALKTGSVTL